MRDISAFPGWSLRVFAAGRWLEPDAISILAVNARIPLRVLDNWVSGRSHRGLDKEEPIAMVMEVMRQDAIAQAPAAQGHSLRAAHAVSVIVALLAAGASLTGLLFPGVYHDKNWLAVAFGNDLVTLVVAVPVLVVALMLSARGSVRGRMVWLGALYYMFYNYAFYVLGLPVTGLYLPLIALFTLSAFALALGLGSLDVQVISRAFSFRTPARLISVYMSIWAVIVGGLWISQWVNFVFSGKIPEVNGDQNAYRVIATVDLSFMVSLLVPAACWLWRRRPWGFPLAVMLNVQGVLYPTVMAMVCVFGWIARPGSQLLSTWLVCCVVFCVASALCLCGLLLNVEKKRV